MPPDAPTIAAVVNLARLHLGRQKPPEVLDSGALCMVIRLVLILTFLVKTVTHALSDL